MINFFWSCLLCLPLVVACSETGIASRPQYAVTGTNNNSASCYLSAQWCIPSHSYRAVNYVKDEVLLTYGDNVSGAQADQLMARYRLRPMQSSQFASIQTTMVVANTNGRDPMLIARNINRAQKKIGAGTNKLYHLAQNNSDAGSAVNPSSYPFSITGVPAAQLLSHGKKVLIGMIDTPIDINNNDFQGGKVRRIDLVPADPKSSQHGTEVAGVMVSSNPEVGIAPDADLFAVSAFSIDPKTQARSSTVSKVATALERCIIEGVDVLNLSFAGDADPLVEKLVNKALSRGIVVVASAGNGGPSASPSYPAAIPGVIAVTAVDRERKLASFANQGDYIDVAAPGVNIMSTAPRGTVHISSGTSLATAHVSAVVALMISINRAKFNAALLSRTASDLGILGKDREYGYGLVNVPRMLSELN